MKPTPDSRRPTYDGSLDCYRVPLSRGRAALIDAQDVPRVSRFTWSFEPGFKTGLAIRRGRDGRRRLLSHVILKLRPGSEVNHANGDTLDCRRGNLRPTSRATSQQAAKKRSTGRMPSSRFKGVSLDGRAAPLRDRWRAQIRAGGRLIHLGRHPTEEAAAAAYDEAALKHFGPFARLNFPPETSAPPLPIPTEN